MKNLYAKLSRTTLKKLSVAFCFWGDLVICTFIYVRLTDGELYDQMWQIMEKIYKTQGISVPPDFKPVIEQMMMNSLIFMISGILLVHSINYLFYYKDKKFAFMYVRILSLFGTLGAFYMGVVHFSGYIWFGILAIIQSFLFAFVCAGTFQKPWLPDYLRKKSTGK